MAITNSCVKDEKKKKTAVSKVYKLIYLLLIDKNLKSVKITSFFKSVKSKITSIKKSGFYCEWSLKGGIPVLISEKAMV